MLWRSSSRRETWLRKYYYSKMRHGDRARPDAAHRCYSRSLVAARQRAAAGEIDADADDGDPDPVLGGRPFVQDRDGEQRGDDRAERDEGAGGRCAQQRHGAAEQDERHDPGQNALIETLPDELAPGRCKNARTEQG